jgi:hypothetical protein
VQKTNAEGASRVDCCLWDLQASGFGIFINASSNLMSQPNRLIYTLHQRNRGRDVYFLVNQNATPVTLRPILRVPGPYMIYRPLTGEVVTAGKKPVLSLGGYEAAFLVK